MAQSPGELWRGAALLPSPPPPTTMPTAPSKTTMRYKLVGVSAYNLNVEKVDQQWELVVESPTIFLFAEPFYQRLLRLDGREVCSDGSAERVGDGRDLHHRHRDPTFPRMKRSTDKNIS